MFRSKLSRNIKSNVYMGLTNVKPLDWLGREDSSRRELHHA